MSKKLAKILIGTQDINSDGHHDCSKLSWHHKYNLVAVN